MQSPPQRQHSKTDLEGLRHLRGMEFHQNMAYWTDSDWTVYASSANENLQFKQSLPFALIGSGAHCHLRLPVQEELDTAYFACNFDDRIELWPLCAIAFPAWGIIPHDVEVLLGQFRLRVEKATGARAERAGCELAPESLAGDAASLEQLIDVDLTMAWEQKFVTKKIARAVTILGSQHPSVWRTRGRGMLPCDHAVVCVGNRVWLVDLHPIRKSFKNPPVCELQANGEYYQIGDMRFSLGPARKECRQSIARRTERDKQLSVHKSETGSEPLAITSNAMKIAPELVSATDTIGSEPTGRSAHAVVASAAAGVLEGLDCPEMLTSRLTGRLVSINQSRFTRGRLMRFVASITTFLVAIAFLFWLFR